tara:strand:+ start:577 stop:708 length:132 start_codon:yes stop_codon:yes gene_type:complete
MAPPSTADRAMARGRILDRIHTRVYLLLLTEVLVVMVVMRDFK